MHPEAVIRETIGQTEEEPTVFIETERFSERVKDVGDWAAPVLPWIKIAAQDWGAPGSGCGIRVNGVEVPIERKALDGIVQEMRTAIRDKATSVSVGGVPVPVTSANLAALEQLQRAVHSRDVGEITPAAPADVFTTTQVLIIETNFDQTSFSKVSVGTRPGKVVAAPLDGWEPWGASM
jgi:hypothetical protein